jgi:hypothetical protein
MAERYGTKAHSSARGSTDQIARTPDWSIRTRGRPWRTLSEQAHVTIGKKWRRRESNPRPKALPLAALHACPVVCRHPVSRAWAPCSLDHLRLDLTSRRRSSTRGQPTFLSDLTGAMGGAPGVRHGAVFRRPARAQRCRWLLLRCPFFDEVRASPACAPGFVALVETGSPPWRNQAPARGGPPARLDCNLSWARVKLLARPTRSPARATPKRAAPPRPASRSRARDGGQRRRPVPRAKAASTAGP